MIDMVGAYAAQGHSVEEVRRYAQGLTAQYQIDVGQMGLNMAAVGNLQGSLERYIGVVNAVPRTKPTDVELNGTEGATQEAAAYGSALDWATRDRVTNVETRVTYGVRIDPAGDKVGDQPVWESYNTSSGASTGIKFFNEGGLVPGFADGGMVPGTPPANPKQDNLLAKVDGKGLIGIRSREFIQPEPAVDYYGLDFMNAIRTMSLPRFSAGGSPSGAGGGAGSIRDSVVELGAATLAAMAEMRQEIKLFTENRVIAESANAGNKELAAEGRN
jgi:hypothetical protein